MIKNFKSFNEAKGEHAKDVHNLTGILDTDIDWYGEDKSNKSKFYEDFKKPIYSVRATFLNLRTYAIKFKLYDVASIVAKWSLGKSPDKLDKNDQKTFDDYIVALEKYVSLKPNDKIEWNDDSFNSESENFVKLFKLVQGIILHESGQLDNDDLGEFKTVQQIVVAAFELKTNDSNSPPAYEKYKVDINGEEYKQGREKYLGNLEVSKDKDKKIEKKDSKNAFKNILKDFKS